MTEELIRVDRQINQVAIVTLCRATKRNALNLALLKQLTSAIEALNRDDDCRVLILTGDGPVFCAGLDLIEATDPAVAEESAELIRHTMTLLRESPQVVIAAAVGAAYAGGSGLVAACDLVVASTDFRLGFPEVRRGLVAAMVSGALARRVRGADVRELLLLGEPVNAERLQQMGLVQWLVPAAQVIERALQAAQTVLAGGPAAVRETKKLINAGPATVDMAYLQELHERVRHSAEAREGFAAFRDKREPNWHTKS